MTAALEEQRAAALANYARLLQFALSGPLDAQPLASRCCHCGARLPSPGCRTPRT